MSKSPLLRLCGRVAAAIDTKSFVWMVPHGYCRISTGMSREVLEVKAGIMILYLYRVVQWCRVFATTVRGQAGPGLSATPFALPHRGTRTGFVPPSRPHAGSDEA